MTTRSISPAPIEYVNGFADFRGLRLEVGPGVYIPRPETGSLIDLAHELVGSQRPLLGVDLCSGSGVVALSLAVELCNVEMHAVEMDATAARWTQRNIRRHHARLTGVGSTVELHLSDALNAPNNALAHLRGRCDLVASNPPYVDADGPSIREIADFAPKVAINGGIDGMDVIRDVIAAASQLLRPGGLLLVEHEEDQGEGADHGGVPGLLRAHCGFRDVRDHRDEEAMPRVTTAFSSKSRRS